MLRRSTHVKILELASRGMTVSQIARRLRLSPSTVSVYVRRPLADPVRSGIPPSSAVDCSPYVLDLVGRVAIMCDIHVPFHDRNAVESAIRDLRRVSPQAIVLGGDILDFHRISRWGHDGSKESYVEELNAGRQLLRYLRDTFPKARILFKEGNHEERLARYLLARAEDLFGLPCLELPELLGLEDLGVEHVGEQRVVQIGRLRLIHGHEYGSGQSTPVNAARWLMLRARRHAVCGHFHHTSEHIEQTIDGEQLAAWSVGCLCSLHPRYRRLNAKWNHGYAVVELFRDDTFEFQNHRIWR